METVWEAKVFSTGIILFLIVSVIVTLYCIYFLIKSRSTPEWGVGKIVCIALIAVLALINLQSIIDRYTELQYAHRNSTTVEGEVENSIIFRGVKVGKGTVVKNCILLQDTYVGDNVSLNCVVTDKNVVIRDGRNLSGHQTMPFFIDKGLSI